MPVTANENVSIAELKATVAQIAQKLGGHIDRAEQIYQEAREERRDVALAIKNVSDDLSVVKLSLAEWQGKYKGGFGTLSAIGALTVGVVTMAVAFMNGLLHWKGANP